MDEKQLSDAASPKINFQVPLSPSFRNSKRYTNDLKDVDFVENAKFDEMLSWIGWWCGCLVACCCFATSWHF